MGYALVEGGKDVQDALKDYPYISIMITCDY